MISFLRMMKWPEMMMVKIMKWSGDISDEDEMGRDVMMQMTNGLMVQHWTIDMKHTFIVSTISLFNTNRTGSRNNSIQYFIRIKSTFLCPLPTQFLHQSTFLCPLPTQFLHQINIFMHTANPISSPNQHFLCALPTQFPHSHAPKSILSYLNHDDVILPPN